MRCARFLLFLAPLMLAGQLAWGQSSEGGQPKQARQSPMAQAMQGRFERNSPDVGTELPDVSGYRSDGSKISLRSLRGKHTVLVFGCLT